MKLAHIPVHMLARSYITSLACVLMGAGWLCGCQPDAPAPAKKDTRPVSGGKVDKVKVDDAARFAMEKAILQARQQIDSFTRALESPTSAQTYFSVKKRFNYSKDGYSTSEDLWLKNVVYADGVFVGFVANEPVYVKDVQLGDKASVNKSDVIDWMIIDNGRLTGGYTIRVLRNLMGDKEREEFDKTAPFKFD